MPLVFPARETQRRRKKGTNVLSEHDGERHKKQVGKKGGLAIVAREKDRGAFCADACA